MLLDNCTSLTLGQEVVHLPVLDRFQNSFFAIFDFLLCRQKHSSRFISLGLITIADCLFDGFIAVQQRIITLLVLSNGLCLFAVTLKHLLS